jgi:hypothetical protein
MAIVTQDKFSEDLLILFNDSWYRIVFAMRIITVLPRRGVLYQFCLFFGSIFDLLVLSAPLPASKLQGGLFDAILSAALTAEQVDTDG